MLYVFTLDLKNFIRNGEVTGIKLHLFSIEQALNGCKEVQIFAGQEYAIKKVIKGLLLNEQSRRGPRIL